METLERKKERMQVVNYKIIKKFKFILFVFLVFIFSCSPVKNQLVPTYNKGGYKLVFLEKNAEIGPNEILIYGKVIDVVTNEPLEVANLSIGCLEFKTSSSGEYSFKIKKSSVLYYIGVSWIGYKRVETGFLNFMDGNVIEIDFFLAEDDRPLINCEGKN